MAASYSTHQLTQLTPCGLSDRRFGTYLLPKKTLCEKKVLRTQLTTRGASAWSVISGESWFLSTVSLSRHSTSIEVKRDVSRYDERVVLPTLTKSSKTSRLNELLLTKITIIFSFSTYLRFHLS